MKLVLFVASLAFLIASAVAMDSINVGAHNNAIQATKRPIEKTDPSLKTKTGADASSVSLTAESTDKLPKKLELWGMYCSKMGDVAVVTKDLPGGFKCNDAALTAEQKNTLQKVITEAIAKEKSPEEAAKWQSEVEKVKPVQGAPAPALSLLMLREQTRRAGHRVSTKVPTLPQYLWPRRTIPYCWEMGWHLWTKVLSWYGMRTIAAHTNMRFEKVACGAPGHKVKWQYVAGQAQSCPAMVYHTAANPCTIFAVPAVPANTNPMPVPAPASTFQVLEYDSARGNSLTAAHEMLHNIGLDHMHQRSDRDTYVKVGANKASANCAKVGAPYVDSAVTYNYDSIMHYGPTGTCKLAALKAKAKAHGDPANMGQRRRWVAVDTTIVNTLYPVAVPL